jgi:carbon-monoxide dehydrogenase medium subunit
MQDFDYVLVHSVADAIAALSAGSEGCRVLSGGTDLLVALRERRCQATLLVDVKHIPETNTLEYDPVAGLRLGAAVPCATICNHPAVRRVYPGLVDALNLIGGAQIQERASVGGNLCHASPAADSIPALIAHAALCIIAGPGGQREVPVEQFCIAPGQTTLQRGEFLVALHLPAAGPGSGAAYRRFTPRNEMDIAVAGAGAAVTLDADRSHFLKARLALGAVAPTPLYVAEAGDWLVGRPVSEEAIAQAATIAQAAARPISDMRGTAAQRRHLSGVLARQALSLAVERARA